MAKGFDERKRKRDQRIQYTNRTSMKKKKKNDKRKGRKKKCTNGKR
jgi:hypothetical protein